MNSLDEFKHIVLSYYKEHKRDLPWRKTDNPYYIVVSEIMLQQTQVPRVIEKYNEFIQTFPTWERLSKAPFPHVLEKWSGLGYNRRAKYVQGIAQKVMNEYNAILPSDLQVLETFPGIGKATAASIAVYAFNIPHVFIETNVRRVFIHHFFKDKEGVSDLDLLPYVQETLNQKNPREWYWALMDYGTYLASTIENPNKKSKHYTKQSKFEGSIRKVRGEILRQFLKHKTMNKEELYLLDEDNQKVEDALSGLVKDCIVKKTSKNRFTLSD